jgi:hypothetical protein
VLCERDKPDDIMRYCVIGVALSVAGMTDQEMVSEDERLRQLLTDKYGIEAALEGQLIGLNDYEQWTFPQIAAWLAEEWELPLPKAAAE